jgi:L,D-peptidoglycan transpeptidase YkuD (ErfK/YbiS/YcfS/YnhG family)
MIRKAALKLVRRVMRKRTGVALLLMAAGLCAPLPALAQTCPAPLAGARRLVLVTAESMNAIGAGMQLFERTSPNGDWRAVGEPEPAMIGRGGMAWSHFFRGLRRGSEPVKVEGDKRAPAGVYAIGKTFGSVPSSRPGHVAVQPDTVCVDDPSSPLYNRIVSRSQAGPSTHVENMSRAMPMYRRGLLVEYPTDARARAGSCIFIHVWKSPTTGTAGCVALPERRIEALQEFAAPGAVLAILPRAALDRLAGCLPAAVTSRR